MILVGGMLGQWAQARAGWTPYLYAETLIMLTAAFRVALWVRYRQLQEMMGGG